jgi:hypothetical protein
MPNWCSNYVEVGHENPEKIRELSAAMERGEFLNHVIPVPEDLKIVAGRVGDDTDADQIELERKTQENIEKYGAGNWYDFCVNRWGTKWDVDCHGQVDLHPDATVVTASFDSAWAPPIGVYDELVEQGYTVRAYYYESGMCFAGIYDNGQDDTYSDWGDAQGAKDTLPQDLDDFFAISESQAEWEAENEEDEDLTEWIKDGVEQNKKLGLVQG